MAIKTNNFIATKRIVDFILLPRLDKTMNYIYELANELTGISNDDLDTMILKGSTFTCMIDDYEYIKKTYWKLTGTKHVHKIDSPY